MTTDLIPYRPESGEMSFQGQKVRHVLIDGEPWFVAVDACRCLGIDVSKGSYYATKPLAADEKMNLSLRMLPERIREDQAMAIFTGTTNQAAIISESGLYKLIMRSDKPVAKAFQDWVTRTVIPSIRKTGGYLLNEEARAVAAVDPAMPTTMAEAIRKQAEALALYADEVEKREEAERSARALEAMPAEIVLILGHLLAS